MSKPEECDGCEFKTDELTSYRKSGLNRTEEEVKWLCKLCANTHTGTAVDYPGHFDTTTLKTICYVGNTILAELRKNNG